MIFVTVGTQLPFDRMIGAIDEWAHNEGETTRIFAQIGPAATKPKHIRYAKFLSPEETESKFAQASLIIAHAGMGSILTALKYQKPIVVLPRMASAGEHRNDHQLATARWLETREGVTVAWTTEQLTELLKLRNITSAPKAISEFATKDFTDKLNRFIKS